MSIARKLMILMATIAAFFGTASAAIDFSGLTDLINATMVILATFVTNSSTLYGFFILMAGLGLITIIVYGFIAKLLTKMSERLGKQ